MLHARFLGHEYRGFCLDTLTTSLQITKRLVRDFALVEAVRIAIEGIDAFSSGIDARYRINRAQHIQVMRNGRLLQLEFCGELGNSHSLLCLSKRQTS